MPYLRRVLCSLILLVVPCLAAADRLTTREGTVFEGEVRLESLTLPAPQGAIEVPRSSIRVLRAEGDHLMLSLVDGTEMAAEVPAGEIGILTGLIVRRLRFEDVAEIVFEHDERQILLRELERGGYARVDDAPAAMGSITTPCPLRIELRLPELGSLASSAERGVRGAREIEWLSRKPERFLCDGVVSISKVEFDLEEKGQRPAALKVATQIRVQPPQDKLASLRLELSIDGQLAASAAKDRIDAEEGRLTTVRTTLEVPRERYQAWVSGAAAVLRFTITAVDH
jgi:hypothetical protein